MHITRHNPAVFVPWRAAISLFPLWVLAIVPADVLAQGCAMCQTVMPHGGEPMARGMFWSVLLLMTMPFVVGGSIGGWLYYKYRSAHRIQRTAASVLPLPLTYVQKEGQP